MLALALFAGCSSGASDGTAPARPVGNRGCGVVCTLAVDAGTMQATVSIDNPSAGKPVKVLSWDLPPDGRLMQSAFAVERGDVSLPLQGPQPELQAPRADDYVWLRPGYEVEASFRLDELYGADTPGEYRIRYQTRLLFGSGPGAGCDLTSNRVRVTRR